MTPMMIHHNLLLSQAVSQAANPLVNRRESQAEVDDSVLPGVASPGGEGGDNSNDEIGADGEGDAANKGVDAVDDEDAAFFSTVPGYIVIAAIGKIDRLAFFSVIDSRCVIACCVKV